MIYTYILGIYMIYDVYIYIYKCMMPIYDIYIYILRTHHTCHTYHTCHIYHTYIVYI